jgi:hypothetical protein
MRAVKPLDYMVPAMQAARIAMEAQTVIMLRMSGMAGFWAMRPDETSRMMAEKLSAGIESATAVMLSGMAGHSLPKLAMAAMKPIRRETRANARRLSKEAAKP